MYYYHTILFLIVFLTLVKRDINEWYCEPIVKVIRTRIFIETFFMFIEYFFQI